MRLPASSFVVRRPSCIVRRSVRGTLSRKSRWMAAPHFGAFSYWRRSTWWASQVAEQETLIRTLAGEGIVTILRVTSNVNLFKLASMRMVAAPHGLAAGPMAVFESVGIDADFFRRPLALNTCRLYRSVRLRPSAARPQGSGKTTPAFNGNRNQQSFFVSEVPVRRVPRHDDGPNFAQGDCLRGRRRQGALRRDDQAILRRHP
jgi:hypothetical protein